MPDLKQLPYTQVVRLIADRDKLAFNLLLGAGASKSSGVPLASEMIDEWRKIAHEEQGAGKDFTQWCSEQDWFGKENEYSCVFEALYPDPPSRQKFIETKIKDAFPSWGYLYLASIVERGRFNVIFTTNFDDLVNDALTVFLGYNPVVCAADSQVSSINITTERAKIIKLHGDYLFQSLKNTVEELRQLDPNMESKCKQFATQCGLVAIGYAGYDHSVMRVFEELLKDKGMFPHGIFWGVRPGSKIAPRVEQLAIAHPKRFTLFQCPDFDSFMARLHDTLKLDLPATILQPYQALEEKFKRLLNAAAQPDAVIAAHKQKFAEELKRPWATADAGDFDLLQAQLALGRRDYKSGLELVERFMAKHPANVDGLTTWGNCLALRGDETGNDADFQQAEAKWQEAVRLDAKALPPRYSLSRHYSVKQRTAEGIIACEELVKLVPQDAGLRRNLVSLYGAASRHEDALREVGWLLLREPNSADLHSTKAAILAQRGLMPESLQEIRTAVAFAPKNPWFRMALATSLAQTAQGDAAAVEFEEAIRLDSRNLGFRLQATNFYWARQQANLALPHLLQAVAIEPQSAEAHGWLCQVYLAVGNIPAAQAEGDRAVQLTPGDSRTRMTAGMAHLQGRRPDLAELHFLKAKQLNPSVPDSYFQLCWLYRHQNRHNEVNVTLQELERVSPQAAQMLRMQLGM